jgi:hypothetical protein
MLSVVMGWFKKVTGLGQLTGVATILAGLMVGIGGLAAWLRDDAVKECNLGWELTHAKRTAGLKDQVEKQTLALKSLELKLTEAQADAERAREGEKVALEKQREAMPSTADCVKCRIPNERIWLRRSSGAPKASGGSPGS